jgi:hypothetical protein
LAISTNFTAQFKDGASPQKALAQWRANRPPWLPNRYQIIEDSYNSVTWQWSHVSFLMKIVTFGGLLGGQTVYRVTALFSPDQFGGSLVTVNGTADPETRRAIEAASTGFEPGGLV